MALKISGSFRKFIFSNKIIFPSSAWSLNSQRGAKSFNEIPRAPEIDGKGCLPYFYDAGGQTLMHKYIDGLHKSLGPIFSAQLKKEIVFLADPDAHSYIYQHEEAYPKRDVVEAWKMYLEETGRERGLFFMDNLKWAEARGIFRKILLNPNSMKYYVGSISKVTKSFVEVLKMDLPKSLKHQLYYWSVECVGEIALGGNLRFLEALKQEGSDSKDVKEKQEFVDSFFNVYIESAKLADVQEPLTLLRETKTEPWPSFCDAMDTMIKYGEQYVQTAISKCSVLKQMNEGENCSNEEERLRASVVYRSLMETWTDRDMISEIVMDLFIGSPDTSSHTALWAVYLLGRNPEVANKAREQIFSVLKKEEPFTLETITKISYLHGILREALRLYSPAPFINRTLPNDMALCGYSVPAGTTVMSSLFTMGRDADNYSDPNVFRPERWFTENKNASWNRLQRRAFAPFSIGKRDCVGRRVAELDLSLLIMELLKNFEWTIEEEVDPILKIITIPEKEFKVDFKQL